jgi:hypothetical protein
MGTSDCPSLDFDPWNSDNSGGKLEDPTSQSGNCERLWLVFLPPNVAFIPMKQAKNFEGGGTISHPENQVYAVFDDADSARQAATALNGAGFGPEKIGVLQGPADAARLAPVAGDQGMLAKLSHLGVDFGDQDRPYLEQYKAELEHGRTVLAVLVENDAEAAVVHQILSERHAHSLTKYGKWAVQALESNAPEQASRDRR